MECESNTAPCLPKRKVEDSVPPQIEHRVESLNPSCSEPTRLQRSWSDPRTSFANYTPSDHTNACLTKPYTIDYANDLQLRLHLEVIHRLMAGTPNQTVREHRLSLLQQIAQWLDVSEVIDSDNAVRDDSYDQLVTILLASSEVKRKSFRELPQDSAEWARLLTQWLRLNASTRQDIHHRSIYRLLAVDGFQGVRARDLKAYLPAAIDPVHLRPDYRRHARAVRRMYDWIDQTDTVSCLTGTDSACVVFLALLDKFQQELRRVLFDEQVATCVTASRNWIENYLHRKASYFKDVRNVDEGLLKELGHVYAETFKEWELVGTELLKSLVGKRFDEEATKVKKPKKKSETDATIK